MHLGQLIQALHHTLVGAGDQLQLRLAVIGGDQRVREGGAQGQRMGREGEAARGQHAQPFLFDAAANPPQGVRRVGGQSLVQCAHMFIPIQLLSARNLAR
ncbi:hypothetical protein D3C72_2161420 [compost metagenome]